MSVRPRRAFVALGSNLGDRAQRLDEAVRSLRATHGVENLVSSTWVETAPVGGPPGQGNFLNGVVAFETVLDARSLLERLQELESAAGRVREVPNGPRTLDLDLLLLGDECIEELDLVVPHPRLEERTFVLAPLSQLAPELVLRGCASSVRERLAELERRVLSPR